MKSFLISIVIVTSIIISGCDKKNTGKPDLRRDTLATVDGAKITEDDFNRQLNFKFNLVLTGRAIKFPLRKFNKEKMRRKFFGAYRRGVGHEVISAAIINRAAEKIGVQATEKELNRVQRQYALKFAGDPEKYSVLTNEINKIGFLPEFLEHIQRDALSMLCIQKLNDGRSYEITDRDIDERIASDDEWNKLVAISNAAAYVSASNVLKRAKAGEDFAKLAEKFSQHEDRVEGGNLGRVFMTGGASICQNEPTYAIAMMMEDGSISDIITSTFGIEILQVYGHDELHDAGDPICKHMRHICFELLKSRPISSREVYRKILERERIQQMYGEETIGKLLKLVPTTVRGYNTPEEYFHEALSKDDAGDK